MPTRHARPGPLRPRGIGPLSRRGLAMLSAGGLVVCLLLPAAPILLGVLLFLAVVIHLVLPDLGPYVQWIAPVPVVGRRKRRTRLALVTLAGVVLVVVGSTTSSLRGTWRGRWEGHERRREAEDDRVTTLLEQAKAYLDDRDVSGAELALMDARATGSLTPEQEAWTENLLERIHRSGDAEAIDLVLRRLTARELEALRGGTVPPALDFGDRALTYRAVELAFLLLDRVGRTHAQYGVAPEAGAHRPSPADGDGDLGARLPK